MQLGHCLSNLGFSRKKSTTEKEACRTRRGEVIFKSWRAKWNLIPFSRFHLWTITSLLFAMATALLWPVLFSSNKMSSEALTRGLFGWKGWKDSKHGLLRPRLSAFILLALFRNTPRAITQLFQITYPWFIPLNVIVLLQIQPRHLGSFSQRINIYINVLGSSVKPEPFNQTWRQPVFASQLKKKKNDSSSPSNLFSILFMFLRYKNGAEGKGKQVISQAYRCYHSLALAWSWCTGA